MAYGIVALLPVALVFNVGSAAGFAMVFALLISAIVWNLGTWYLGLPASSSHTMIGSILGVGLANSVLSGHAFGEGVNWSKAGEVGTALLVSPVVGFVCSALLLFLLKALVKQPALFSEPAKDKAPPAWIRGVLVLTCTGVSFAHGSNDGQKGMGLIVLILVGILPGTYALKMAETPEKVHAIATQAHVATAIFEKKAAGATADENAAVDELSAYIKPAGALSDKTYAGLATISRTIETKLGGIKSFGDLPESDRRTARTDIYLVASGIGKLAKANAFTEEGDQKATGDFKKQLDSVTK